MKKLCLLSGAIVLSAWLTAMERPFAWEQLDACNSWGQMIAILSQHKGTNLVNDYRNEDNESLLELAVKNYNVSMAKTLVETFGAEISQKVLDKAIEHSNKGLYNWLQKKFDEKGLS